MYGLIGFNEIEKNTIRNFLFHKHFIDQTWLEDLLNYMNQHDYNETTHDFISFLNNVLDRFHDKINLWSINYLLYKKGTESSLFQYDIELEFYLFQIIAILLETLDYNQYWFKHLIN